MPLLRGVAALALGVTLGVAATLIVAPFHVSANDDAGVRGFVFQDARTRAGQRWAAPSEVAARAAQPRQPSRIENFFQPILRSFAPQPRVEARRPLPAPIAVGYPGPDAERMRAIDRTGAPQTETRKPAAARRDAPAERSVAALPRRTVCVRTCDGYHFPIGNLDDSSDLRAHESMCQSACPGAPVRLYTMAEGAESIEQAVSRDRGPYSALPTAFAYRTARNASCSCQPQGGGVGRLSALRDFTLRPGDAVVTAGTAEVFSGSSAWPFRASDFTDFQASRQLKPDGRKKVDSIVGASYARRVLKPYTVARVTREAPPPVADIEIVRPERRADVRRIDGPNGRPLSSTARIVVVSGPDEDAIPATPATLAAARIQVARAQAAAVPARVAGPAIITVDSGSRSDAASAPSRRGQVIVTSPRSYAASIRVVESRATPGFYVVR